MKKIILLSCILILLPLSSFASTINIPGDQATIQAGIDAAADGDVVLLDDGTYAGVGNYNIDFSGKSITVKSSNGTGNCIVDCQKQGRGFIAYRGEKIILDGLVIRNGDVTDGNGGGVYITHSEINMINCVFDNNSSSNDSGGAIYSESSAVFLTNCIFTDNSATGGGAIYFQYSPSPSFHFSIVTDCTFTNNSALGRGGAVTAYASSSTTTPTYTTFDNCTFTGNITTTSSYGSGGAVNSCSTLHTATFVDCTFSDNSSPEGSGGAINSWFASISNCTFTSNRAAYGGAVKCSNSTLTNCTFTGNSVTSNLGAEGGAVDCSSSTLSNCTFTGNSTTTIYCRGGGAVACSSSTLSCCVFVGNSAVNKGGAVRMGLANLVNCIFTNNSASNGGAVVCYLSSTAACSYLTNCTFTSNVATVQGGAIDCSIYPLDTNGDIIFKNCILWGNTAPQGAEIKEFGNPIIITYSDIQGSYTGEGNIDSDPLFLPIDTANSYIHPYSPCIDTGTADGAPGDDIDGYIRPIGSGDDMGAYEYRNDIYIWEGQTSDWSDTSNWKYNATPNHTDFTIISLVQAVASPEINFNDATAGTLMVESGTLTIGQGKLSIGGS